MKEIFVKKLRSSFFELINFLTKLNINYWVGRGLIEQIAKEKIDDDETHDIDFHVLLKDKNFLLSHLERENYKIRQNRDYKIQVLGKEDNTKIEFVFLFQDQDIQNNYVHQSQNVVYSCPKNLFGKKEIAIDNKKIVVPYPFDVYLRDCQRLKDTTLVFLIKKYREKIIKVCLGMKKRGFGKDKWNGVGGKVDKDNETVEGGAIREANEEIGVRVKDLIFIADLRFFFLHNSDWNKRVSVFTTACWEGRPKESEEMKPKWFPVEEIPYKAMWSGDEFWLPEVLEGNLIRASFTFDENDLIIEKEVNKVTALTM